MGRSGSFRDAGVTCIQITFTVAPKKRPLSEWPTKRPECPLRDMVENSSALVDLLSLGVCHEYLCRVQSGEIRL